MDHTDMPRTNWAANLRYSTDRLYTPRDLSELQKLVRTSERLKQLGTRHSFNAIADSTHAQVTLAAFQDIEMDAQARTVSIGAGVPYGVLAPRLDRAGFALHNLASLPHISVAGAVATATHGSGVRNGNLATAVRGLEMVTASGDLLTLTQADDDFRMAIVHLGAVGVVTRLTLAIEPRFEVAQSVYRALPFDTLRDHFDEVMGSAYSVSLFLSWQGHQVDQVWVKRRVGTDMHAGEMPPPEFFGATLQEGKLHPLPGHGAENCTEQMGVAGPWHERLPHFRMEFTPSSGEELQTEYFVPREHAFQAITALEQMRDRISPLLFVTEVRAVAEDDLPMSMNYGRDSIGLHFTWRPLEREVRALLPEIEAVLAPFHARPHWGKISAMPAEKLVPLYPRMHDFLAYAGRMDPSGKFRNTYLDALFSAA